VSSSTALIVDAAIDWYNKIEDSPSMWADAEDYRLIRAVEYYLDVKKWGNYDE